MTARKALMLLCVLTCTGCCRESVVKEVETLRMYPPEELMVTTEPPVLSGPTMRDVISTWLTCDTLLRSCNVDKEAIREWGAD